MFCMAVLPRYLILQGLACIWDSMYAGSRAPGEHEASSQLFGIEAGRNCNAPWAHCAVAQLP